MTPAGEAAYVATVLMMYTDLPDTPSRPSSLDQTPARRLHQQGVPFSLVESALLLACAASSAPITFPHCRASVLSPISNQ